MTPSYLDKEIFNYLALDNFRNVLFLVKVKAIFDLELQNFAVSVMY